MRAIAGEPPRFFRAPAGLRNPFLDPVLARCNCSSPAGPGAASIPSARRRRGVRPAAAALRGGDILLLHDGNAARNAAASPCSWKCCRGCSAPWMPAGLTPVTLRSGGRAPENRVLSDISPPVSCIGRGLAPITRGAARRAQRPCALPLRDRRPRTPTWARCRASTPERLPAALRAYDCRNNRLAQLALSQDGFADAVRPPPPRRPAARRRVPRHQHLRHPRDRDRLSASRSGRAAPLPADFQLRRRPQHVFGGRLPAPASGLEGPAAVVSCACASSAKVFASARRMIEAGLIDAALVGGVDSLCLTTLYGFHSLQLCSPAPCRPFDVDRDGISIGEAAAFALLERCPASARTAASVAAAGHRRIERRAPHVGAASGGPGRARRHAGGAAHAGLEPEAIDYINLHGTARRATIAPRACAVTAVFGADDARAVRPRAPRAIRWVPPARSKRWSARSRCTDGFLPGGRALRRRVDPALGARLSDGQRRTPADRVLSAIPSASAAPTAAWSSAALAMSLSAPTSTGIGVLGPGLPGLAGGARRAARAAAVCAAAPP